MLEIVDTPAEAASLALAPLIIRRPLEAFLDAHGLGDGPVELSSLGEGHSNLTYLVRRGGTALVLRRPPRPPLPPRAHDVIREARVISALRRTGARVPRVLAIHPEPDVIGAPFFLMEHVAGDVIGAAVPPRWAAAAARRRIGEELIDALAELHAVDWRAGALARLAPDDGYLERQMRLFARLWEHNKTREVPDVDRVSRWLAANRPQAQPTTVVHGDYRLGNTMFGPGAEPRLVAIFDWEMATLGDPLADVGYLAANWPQGDEADDVMTALSRVVREPGFPSREQLLERYAARTGRELGALRWYETLAAWKTAVFLEGSYGRYLASRAADPFFGELRDGVPALAARARRLSGA